MARTKADSKTRLTVSAAINLALIIMELYALISSYIKTQSGFFSYYTQDSNIFALIACVISLTFTLRALIKGKAVPEWVTALKYMAVCCLAVTFFVVVTVLAPPYGLLGFKIALFRGNAVFLHLLCPVIAVCSFIIFESEHELTAAQTFYALIPTVIYAMIALILNLAGTLTGPYPFLHVYEQPVYMTVIWFVLILGIAYVLALIIKLLACGRKSKNVFVRKR